MAEFRDPHQRGLLGAAGYMAPTTDQMVRSTPRPREPDHQGIHGVRVAMIASSRLMYPSPLLSSPHPPRCSIAVSPDRFGWIFHDSSGRARCQADGTSAARRPRAHPSCQEGD
ncbi:hypothetical protein [Streptomyces sp. NPDC057582]|uniref:hypothetical protein n=1 Tax=Streptomyces sp. NPDC057582 TaxID=3346174 RepID=UPI0036BC14F1